jgi:hypothetical protein
MCITASRAFVRYGCFLVTEMSLKVKEIVRGKPIVEVKGNKEGSWNGYGGRL